MVLALPAISAAVLTPRNRVLLRDSFTDANSTALASHTPELGGPWTARVGTFTVQSNAIQVATVVSQVALATIPAGRADLRMRAALTPATGSIPGLAFRYADNNNYWYADLWPAGGATKIRLVEVASGITTVIATAAPTVTVGVTYLLEVVARGPVITVALDGAVLLSYLTAATGLAATVAGVRGFTVSTAAIDDFLVTGL